MTTPNPGVKPPPLHERSDVLENITALYKGGNNLLSVQDTFRGALLMLCGTAIPKAHYELVASIRDNAEKIEMARDKDVLLTVAWVFSEKERHPPKPAVPQVDEPRPDHADRRATELGASRRTSSDGNRVA